MMSRNEIHEIELQTQNVTITVYCTVFVLAFKNEVKTAQVHANSYKVTTVYMYNCMSMKCNNVQFLSNL